ncbi:MAG: hypothetical protein IPJ76_11435 [Flavobacteriales bacterium]|nr:MAG: hypothetical protein IPJ76_11435 [Flavobacteriales bacterium]
MRNVTLILGLAAATLVQAQSWCPPGARWTFNTSDVGFVESQTFLTYVGDTVVDGFPSQHIAQVSAITQLWGNDTLIVNDQLPVFTRVDGDVVFDWDYSDWDTLFWFGSVPGDEWQPHWSFGWECPDRVLHVLDTSTIVIDGLALRHLDVEVYWSGVPTGIVSSITERIGGGSWQAPPPCGAAECTCTMICYRDNDISHPIDSCEFTLGIYPERPAIGQLTVFAERDVLSVQVPDEMVGGIMHIRDAIGREVLSARVAAPRTDYPTQGFARGAYSILVVNGAVHRSARAVLP